MKLEVIRVLAVAKAPQATVELRVPTDDAGAWLLLLDQVAEVRVVSADKPKATARRLALVAASKRRQAKEAQAEADTTERRKAAATPKPPRLRYMTPGANLRRQLPEGWLTVGDYAAECGVNPTTVYNWIRRGKQLGKGDVQRFPVDGAKTSEIYAIRAGAQPRKRKRHGALRNAIQHLGVGGVADRLRVSSDDVQTWVAENRVPSPYCHDVRDLVVDVTVLAEERAALPEGAMDGVPYHDEPPKRDAAEAAWGEA